MSICTETRCATYITRTGQCENDIFCLMVSDTFGFLAQRASVALLFLLVAATSELSKRTQVVVS